MDNEKEIPFGAFDSELMEATYFIPQDYHAVIDGNKVIIKKGKEPVNNDLEETSKQYALNNSPWDDCWPEVQDAFKAGAQWQKKQTENDDEKLSKAVKLADAMYYAAHQLITDASRLMETMKDWWNFKNVELNNKEYSYERTISRRKSKSLR